MVCLFFSGDNLTIGKIEARRISSHSLAERVERIDGLAGYYRKRELSFQPL